MKKTICDKCKKEFEEEDFDKITCVTLPYIYSAKAWQCKKFDLCDECVDKLKELIEQTKCDFITKE